MYVGILSRCHLRVYVRHREKLKQTMSQKRKKYSIKTDANYFFLHSILTCNNWEKNTKAFLWTQSYVLANLCVLGFSFFLKGNHMEDLSYHWFSSTNDTFCVAKLRSFIFVLNSLKERWLNAMGIFPVFWLKPLKYLISVSLSMASFPGNSVAFCLDSRAGQTPLIIVSVMCAKKPTHIITMYFGGR